MWYPVHQQQHSCYGYARHHPSHQQQQQQQQTYLRTSYYCNTDELSTTCVEAINDENDSSNHCQTTYSGNAHVTTPNYYVTPSLNPYGDEMSSHQTTTTTRKTYWNPIIVAPNRNMNMFTPSVPIVSSSSLSHTSSCWDWLLYSPEYYSEFYTPSSTYIQQQKFDEEDDKENDHAWSFSTSLPTCLLTLLCLTPQLIQTSHDENDSDQEMNTVHSNDESSLPLNHTNATTLNNISSNLLLSSINTTKSNSNRSSTPDTDDGYQSANDASRSDYSQATSVPYDHHSSKDDISVSEHSLPKPLMPRRISYAAAAKPITTATSSTTKISSLPSAVSKPKQTINKTLAGITTINDISNTNGQKLKFIAPRFERMHHAKQNSSPSTTTIVKPSPSSTASNRTQTRSTNINNNNYHQRNHMINSTRRR